MRHLTVDFTADPPTYTYIVDGVTSTTPARSVFSALHVAGIVKCRGVSVVTIGQKQALKKVKKGKPTMALSKPQQADQQQRFVNALQQFIGTGTITGRGCKNLITAMERQGLIITHQGSVQRMTDAGLAYYHQHRDADSAVIDADLVQKLETLIGRIPDFQVFNADAFTTRDGLLSTIDELADDAIITRLIHTIRVLNDVIGSG